MLLLLVMMGLVLVVRWLIAGTGFAVVCRFGAGGGGGGGRGVVVRRLYVTVCWMGERNRRNSEWGRGK